MQVVLSTRNPSKSLQIKAIFDDPRILLYTLADVGIEGQAVEDNFPSATIQGNALKKARFARERIKPEMWATADDTGVFIDGLNGEPGVMAATWAGSRATTEQIMQHALDRMFCLKDRKATMETVVALIGPDGIEHTFSGRVQGNFLKQPRMQPQPNMPYSSLFIPDGTQKVWAEMTTEEENAVSHRGKAARAALEFLKTFL